MSAMNEPHEKGLENLMGDPQDELSTRLSSAVSALPSSQVRELLRYAKLPGMISMAGGLPSDAHFDVEGVREAARAALAETFGDAIEVNSPQGGMFFRARFRRAIDTTQLLERARTEGMIFVPGAAFYPSEPDVQTLRLSFVTVAPEELREGVRRLARAYRAESRT